MQNTFINGLPSREKRHRPPVLLDHASVPTTERYLGCKQNLEEPVNDRFGYLFSKKLNRAKACYR
jgi:hypothetical protein